MSFQLSHVIEKCIWRIVDSSHPCTLHSVHYEIQYFCFVASIYRRFHLYLYPFRVYTMLHLCPGVFLRVVSERLSPSSRDEDNIYCFAYCDRGVRPAAYNIPAYRIFFPERKQIFCTRILDTRLTFFIEIE